MIVSRIMAEMSIPEAAAILGITKQAIYAAIERREIKPIERLGKLGLTEREVEKFRAILESRTRRGPKREQAA
jgi:hypothetical protein